MKIVVMSDTHGHYGLMKKVIKQMGEADYIIHLGDYLTDGTRLSLELDREVVCVKGNCDFSVDIPHERELEINHKKIFITHGHRYHVKWGYDQLLCKGEEVKADLILYGHTHFPEIFYNGNTLYMNPGSVGEPRGGVNPSFGIIHLVNGKFIPYIVNIV